MTAIIAARRTAVCPRGGAFARLSLEALAVPVIAAVLADAGMAATRVDEVIVANALGAGGNPARRVALAAGLPERVAGLTVDRQCAGGLDAIRLAVAMSDAGQAEVVLAGGVESYSRRPLRYATDPDGGEPVAYDQPAFTPWPERDPDMTQAAAALAERLGISREAQDAWAVESHRKAQGLRGEIVAVAGVARDAFTRGLTLAQAGRAKVLAGTVTAANAAVAADGAAFCLVVSDRIAAGARGALQVLGSATLGADPVEPGIAALAAMRAVGVEGIMQAEIMEAYAVQAMACVAGARIDPAIVNPGGGALARGHPIGASGAILAVRLFHDLAGGEGLAAIAAAGGIGTAMRFGR
ncbi:MAG: thiolase family protein [Paracoccaceae bacterium]